MKIENIVQKFMCFWLHMVLDSLLSYINFTYSCNSSNECLEYHNVRVTHKLYKK